MNVKLVLLRILAPVMLLFTNACDQNRCDGHDGLPDLSMSIHGRAGGGHSLYICFADCDVTGHWEGRHLAGTMDSSTRDRLAKLFSPERLVAYENDNRVDESVLEPSVVLLVNRYVGGGELFGNFPLDGTNALETEEMLAYMVALLESYAGVGPSRQ